MENVAKSKTMTCHQGAIWLGMLEEVVGWSSTGKLDTQQESLWYYLPCLDYGVELAEGSITDH